MKLILLKVYFEAFKQKLKKLIYQNYDPYLPLPNNIFLSPSLSIFNQYKSSGRELSFLKTNLKPKEWQKLARKKLILLSGYNNKRKISSIINKKPELKIDNNIYMQSIYMRLEKYSDIPIKLIYKKPIKDSYSVFIYLAGSSSGSNVGWGEVKLPIDHQRISIGADIAKQAANKGYLAVAIEQLGYGERLERHLHKKSKDRTIDASNHLLLLGKTLMGVGATEVSSVIDWLGNNKNLKINKKKIFLFGHSSGGTLAQYVAALDERVNATVASGSVGEIKETIGARGASSGDGIIPGFLKYFDTSDLIALISPRTFIGLSGDNDHIFPFKGVNKVIKKAEVFYKKTRAQGNIKAIKARGGHKYYNKETWQAWSRYIDKI